jgi:hypothetical protein
VASRAKRESPLRYALDTEFIDTPRQMKLSRRRRILARALRVKELEARGPFRSCGGWPVPNAESEIRTGLPSSDINTACNSSITGFGPESASTSLKSVVISNRTSASLARIRASSSRSGRHRSDSANAAAQVSKVERDDSTGGVPEGSALYRHFALRCSKRSPFGTSRGRHYAIKPLAIQGLSAIGIGTGEARVGIEPP